MNPQSGVLILALQYVIIYLQKKKKTEEVCIHVLLYLQILCVFFF